MPSDDVPRAVSGLGGWLDDRFGGARATRNLMNKVFPDHWTFVIELLTGTYLALFFVPSLNQVGLRAVANAAFAETATAAQANGHAPGSSPGPADGQEGKQVQPTGPAGKFQHRRT